MFCLHFVGQVLQIYELFTKLQNLDKGFTGLLHCRRLVAMCSFLSLAGTIVRPNRGWATRVDPELIFGAHTVYALQRTNHHMPMMHPRRINTLFALCKHGIYIVQTRHLHCANTAFAQPKCGTFAVQMRHLRTRYMKAAQRIRPACLTRGISTTARAATSAEKE